MGPYRDLEKSLRKVGVTLNLKPCGKGFTVGILSAHMFMFIGCRGRFRVSGLGFRVYRYRS